MQRTRGAWDQPEASARTGWLECMLEAVDTAGCSLTRDPPRTGTASVARGPLAPASMPAPGGAQHTALGPVSSDSLLGVAVGGAGTRGTRRLRGHSDGTGSAAWGAVL